MKIPIVGGSYQGRVKDINSQRCVNMFPSVDPNGKEVLSLQGTPGLKEWWDFSNTAPIRALHTFNDRLFIIIGNALFEITITNGIFTSTSRGTIGTHTGYVWMVDNRTQLMVVDGAEGYVLQADNTFGAIADGDFPVPSSLTYQDGYFIVSKSTTDQFHISASLDGLTWDPTEFAVASAQPDKLVAVYSHLNNLFCFGERSTEIYYNSGDADFPFDLVPGGVIEVGLAAAASPAASKNGDLFVFSSDFQVRRIVGLRPEIVSTPQITYQFEQYSDKSDAIGFMVEMEGQVFYTLTFPTAKRTWQYNATSGFWNEWNSYPDYDKHRAQAYVYFDKKHLIGDYGNGKLYQLDFDTYTDDGNDIIAYRTFRAITAERKNIFFDTLEIEMETGTEPPVTEAERLDSDPDNWTLPGEWQNSGGNLYHPTAT
jgi:hypothetical protein